MLYDGEAVYCILSRVEFHPVFYFDFKGIAQIFKNRPLLFYQMSKPHLIPKGEEPPGTTAVLPDAKDPQQRRRKSTVRRSKWHINPRRIRILTGEGEGFMKGKGKLKYAALGFVSGILNGLFGAGGGVIVVPMLEKFGIPAKKSHATSIAIILPASLISAALYFFSGNLNLTEAAAYLPTGLLGAGLGALLLKKITVKWLKLIFALVIIAGAVRILVQ